MRKQQDLFNLMLNAFENTGNIMLRYQFQKEMFLNSLFERQQREKLKAEIEQDIMSRISATIDDAAIKQLHEMLKNLGK